MTDLETALLTSLLDFSRRRLATLLTTIAPDVDHLVTALAPAASVADRAAAAGTAAGTDLDTAAVHLTNLADAIAASPQSLADCALAYAELSQSVTAVDAAVGAVSAVIPAVGARTVAFEAVVRQAVSAGGDVPSGLLAQLGLGGTLSGAITHTGTSLEFTATATPAHSIGDLLSVANTTVTATLDYSAAGKLGAHVQTTATVGVLGDGFVEQILGNRAAITTAVDVAVDTSNGLRFSGGAKKKTELPGQLVLPGVKLFQFGVAVPDQPPTGLAFTGTIQGGLGPITAVVEGLGVLVTIDPAQLSNGSPIVLDGQPPDGAGLTIDAGPVKGGGFVEHHGDQYGGALDLALGPIEIKAVGLIETDPFSLVLVLSVRFTPGVQLSFGFTLNAVGGLVALERTIATDVLRTALHDHTADTVLFPSNPVASAPAILAALGRMFPAQQGAFVAGPILELGWGTPISYVTARLGVLIALPDPKVVIIGSLRVALPAPDLPIVDLRADIYGEITPDHLLFLVSLGGSKLAGFSLVGDFGLLIAWGDKPDLAISAGGFHPHYTPPAELSGMRRVGVDLSPPSFLTLRAEAYLALTANSFQLGTRVELRADVGGVGAEGHLQFDALVLWEPTFHFEIDLSAGVSLYAFGESFASVDLRLHLSGPGPWVVSGHASISLLFFDVDLDIPTITWGSGDNTPPDGADPQQLVHDALADPKAWQARPPEDAERFVRLIAIDSPPVPVVHPLGALEARQHAVPLETDITHIGAHPVSVGRVNLGAPVLAPGSPNPRTPTAISSATDSFAPGNFLDLTEDQKLSRPAFEPFPSGIVIAAETAVFGTPTDTQYEWFTVCPPVQLRPVRAAFSSLIGLHAMLLAAGPAGIARVDLANPYVVAPSPVTIADPGTAYVRSTTDLTTVDGIDVGAMTTTAATRLVDQLGAAAQWVGPGVTP